MLKIFALITLGVPIGYLIATLGESYFHHRIGHASVKTREFWARHPWFGRPFLNAFYSHHVIHHARTFRKDFVTQFTSEEEEAALYASMPEDRRDSIRHEEYGMTLKGFGIVMFVLPITPSVLPLYFAFGPWVTLGAAFPMFVVYPLMSKWIHRMIHKSDEGVTASFTPLDIWIMSTRYIRFVLVDHFLHHKYVMCNFNLLRGGDYIRRVHREPSEKDLVLMRRVGIMPPVRKTPISSTSTCGT